MVRFYFFEKNKIYNSAPKKSIKCLITYYTRMAFRKYGGLNYAATNNIIRNHYQTSDNFSISDVLGQYNSKIVSESHLDMSGNSLLNVETIYFMDGTSLSTSPTIGQTGTQGAQGQTGSQGAQGQTGAQGITGSQGQQGQTGTQGQTGAQGLDGLTGQQGITGPQGQQGQTGSQGQPGTTSVVISIPNFQTSWINSSSGIPNTTNLNSLALNSSGQYQTAVSSFDGIYYSNNYGSSWLNSDAPSSSLWLSNSMSYSGQYQSAGPATGVIYYSNNFGVNWLVSNSISARWNSVSVSALGQQQIAAADSQRIHYSNDYGATWNPHNSSPVQPWYSCAISAADGKCQTAVFNTGAIVGTGGIYYSIDAGITWSQATTPSNNVLYINVAMSSYGEYQTCVAYQDGIYYSNDYGANWTKSLDAPTTVWSSVSMDWTGQYQVANAPATNSIYFSSNFGKNWVQSTLSGQNYVYVSSSASGQYQSATDDTRIYIGKFVVTFA